MGGSRRETMGGRRARSWAMVPSDERELGGGCVWGLEICSGDTCVIFSLRHWPSSTSLAVCRQQLISGPDRICKGKWEEIWSIWWHYKAHRWFAGFIKTCSRLHHCSLLASCSPTCSLCPEILPPSSAAPVICLTPVCLSTDLHSRLER